MEWAAFGRPIRFLYQPDCIVRPGSGSSAFSVRWPQTLVDRCASDRIRVQERSLGSRSIRDWAARSGRFRYDRPPLNCADGQKRRRSKGQLRPPSMCWARALENKMVVRPLLRSQRTRTMKSWWRSTFSSVSTSISVCAAYPSVECSGSAPQREWVKTDRISRSNDHWKEGARISCLGLPWTSW